MTDPAISSIISRLEAASENDVALFMDVYDAVTPSPTDDGTRTAYLSGGLRFLACLRCDAFLDAIVALIERALPGCWWEVEREFIYDAGTLRERCVGRIRAADTPYMHVRAAPTPALALCLALVRAKAAMMEKSE